MLEDYRKAIGYFDQAIQLDPDYALAYAERSEAWILIGDLTGQRATAFQKRGAMRRKPSRLRLDWRKRTRPSAGFAFLSIGNSLKA